MLNDEDNLHQNTRDYFKYFLDHETTIKVSTISIAEYCVKGSIEELPLKNIQIVPFNLDHAKKAGEFANIIFEEKKLSAEDLKPRAIIPNDAKLFAQADTDKSITHFVTSDSRSQGTFKLLKNRIKSRFEIIDINNPYHQVFGLLDLK
ncbi:MAG: hypothetical protein ACOCVX_04225 [Bacteroidales bacterium]